MGGLSECNVIKVTNIQWMFALMETSLHGMLAISNVTNMESMFRYSTRFTGDVSQWDVSSDDDDDDDNNDNNDTNSDCPISIPISIPIPIHIHVPDTYTYKPLA
jgi:hypothetical protein